MTASHDPSRGAPGPDDPAQPILRRAGPVASGRRRSAPTVEVTSDERRFVGVGLGAVVAALATVAGIMSTVEPQRLQSPGPLARPHVQAKLSCASCHDDARAQPRDPRQACVDCHGSHPSTRVGHRRMVEQGALGCTSCHRVHRDMGGVALGVQGGSAQGDPVRFGPGAEVVVPLPEGTARPQAPWVVPLIPVDACSTCHDPAAERDPIRRCLLSGQQGLGPQRPTTCLDEHRVLDGLTISDDETRRRLAAWSIAKTVALRAPVAPKDDPSPSPAWVWLGLGLTAGGAAWGGARVVQRLRRRKPTPQTEAVSAVPEVKRLPVIDTSTCIGCYACVDACPYDVLAVERFVAKVVRPDDCCGLTLCEQRCPNGSLVVTDGDPIEDRPAIDATLQSRDVPGLYLAGDLTGLPLIRNAINQGAAAVEAAMASLQGRRHEAPLDLVIVGAGPAGISAALAAAQRGLRYRVIEQGSVAESIRSFPRGKLVFDQPLGLPMVGDLWLAESTKEELVGKWLRVVRQQGLRIDEHCRVTAIDHDAAGMFTVRGLADTTNHAWVAPRVILAIGRRGTPRKLPVELPDAVVDRVHYSMADARSFAGRRVVVVGLGDVAMEAAVALSRQPGTDVTVVYRGDGFRRGKQRNVDELKRRVTAGRVALRLKTEIAAVHDDRLVLRGPGADETIGWDTILVMIGSIAPWEFLLRAGVQRVGGPTG